MNSLIAFEIRNGKYDNALDEVLEAARERKRELDELAERYTVQLEKLNCTKGAI